MPETVNETVNELNQQEMHAWYDFFPHNHAALMHGLQKHHQCVILVNGDAHEEKRYTQTIYRPLPNS